MKYIKQMLIIFLFTVIGELLSVLISPWLSLPASILGMISLFACLHWKIIPIKQVKDLGDFLTGNMAILFIPGGVGLLTQFHLIQEHWLAWLLIIFVSTMMVLIVVGILMESSLKISEAKKVSETHE